jgi:hypothetical protein
MSVYAATMFASNFDCGLARSLGIAPDATLIVSLQFRRCSRPGADSESLAALEINALKRQKRQTCSVVGAVGLADLRQM